MNGAGRNAEGPRPLVPRPARMFTWRTIIHWTVSPLIVAALAGSLAWTLKPAPGVPTPPSPRYGDVANSDVNLYVVLEGHGMQVSALDFQSETVTAKGLVTVWAVTIWDGSTAKFKVLLANDKRVYISQLGAFSSPPPA